MLLLAWFAIGLAGRYTGRDRRADAALLKLRGSNRLGMLRLAFGQHLVPLVGGRAGRRAARACWPLARWPGRWPPTTWPRRLTRRPAAVGAVLAGGLLVLVAVEAAVLRRPVAALLRRVPSGPARLARRRRRPRLLAVAVAGIYQARYGGPAPGSGLVAPALVALAVALLPARLLSRLADRAGAVALRRGRLRFGLTAVQVSRQPGTDRVFALVVVAVAMFATAAGGWAGRAHRERTDRGEAELGAARVLTVQAANRTALLHAVRAGRPGRPGTRWPRWSTLAAHTADPGGGQRPARRGGRAGAPSTARSARCGDALAAARRPRRCRGHRRPADPARGQRRPRCRR